MIYLNQSNNNTVTVSLYGLCQNVINPFFTWQITDKATNNTVVFCADDNSNSAYYYNQFTISVVSIAPTATPYGSTAGIIYTNAGAYDYVVYEMANQYDTNINDAVGIIDTGILQINGTYSPYLVDTTQDGATIFVDKSLNFYDQ